MGRHGFKNILKYSTICIFVTIIIGYSIYQSKSLLEGPIIVITSPENGTSSHLSLIEIGGYTKNITTININDRPIFIDDNGLFKEKYLLSPGYNMILIQAKDKFNRITQKTLELVYVISPDV